MFFNSDFETLVHLLKCSLGTGILAMPQAFARSGLVTGILATVIVGIIVTYCLHVLVRINMGITFMKITGYDGRHNESYNVL